MIRIFAVLNGAILHDDQNWSPTYTRIRFLLSELARYDDVRVDSISFRLLPAQDLVSRLYNNAVKTAVALRSLYRLLRDRPLVFFAYPHSLTTFQNRFLFVLCTVCKIPTIIDIHDTREQAAAVSNGRSGLHHRTEQYCFANATLTLTLNPIMWEHIQQTHHLGMRPVAFVPHGFEEEFFVQHPAPYSPVEGRFNICYIGALTKNRGIDLIVHAGSILRERYPWVRLYLIGPYGPGITDDLKGVIDNSDFIIRRELPRSAIPAALTTMDLLVLPYNPREHYLNITYPTKIFEYIGAAKPILCTKCRSLLELGEYGGIQYCDYSIGAMVTSIESLITQPVVREQLAQETYHERIKHTWRMRTKIIRDTITAKQWY